MKRRRVNSGKIAKTRLSTAEVRATIARMEREGHTQKEIGAALGISAPAVNVHIRKMREEYQRSIDTDLTYMIYERNLELEEIKFRAGRGWELSKAPALDEDGNPGPERPGDPAFLKVQIDAIKSQRELFGLDKATKVEQKNLNLNVTLPPGAPVREDGSLDYDALSRFVDEPDPVETETGGQAALPPWRGNAEPSANGHKVRSVGGGNPDLTGGETDG